MDLNAIMTKAAAAATDKIETMFGTSLLALNDFFSNNKVPVSVRSDVAKMLEGVTDRLAKADWSGDADGVLGAFTTGLVRVGADPLSDAEDAAIQAAMSTLRFAGSREDFLRQVASSVISARDTIAELEALNAQHLARITDLEEIWETGGDPADPDSWKTVENERNELAKRLDKIEKALGMTDLDLVPTSNLDAAVKARIQELETAAKTTVTATIDDATKDGFRKEGADGVIAAVKPFIEKVNASWPHVIVRGDKDKQLGVILAADGLDESIRNAAKSAVGL
jgi:hypothetical protein